MNPVRDNIHASSQAAAYDEGLRSYMLGVYNYMTAGVALTGIVAWLMAAYLPIETLMTVNTITFFAMLAYAFLVLPRIAKVSVQAGQMIFFGYATLIGALISSLFAVYTDMSIARAFLVAAAGFGGLSLYGYTTKKDLSGWRSFLMIGVWGLLATIVINGFFIESAPIHYAMCAIGVLIFGGLTAYETQAIRRSYYEVGGNPEIAAKVSILGALNLYSSFINIFIFLLQLLGNRE